MGVVRAWAWLVALSLIAGATTWVTPAAPGPRMALAGAVVTLSVVKARLVLGVYLGLARVPAWRRGFDIGLIAFALGAGGLCALAL